MLLVGAAMSLAVHHNSVGKAVSGSKLAQLITSHIIRHTYAVSGSGPSLICCL